MSSEPLKVEIDKIDRDSWDHLMTQFDDSSLYQTWSFGATGGSISHVVVKAGDDIVGGCQAIVRQLLCSHVGIADIVWGPFCMKKGETFKPDVLFRLVRGIKEEYGIKRGYLLRVWPHAMCEKKEVWKHILETEGFMSNAAEQPYQTLMLDLSPSLDDLRKNLAPRWRTSLNSAERNALSIIEGTSDNLFNKFLSLERECRKIKQFTTGMNYEAFRRAQNDLFEPLKMKLMICYAQGEPVCASAYSTIGYRGVYTLGATGEKGYELNASYLLQWQMIKRLKEIGVRYYDLGGVDAKLNPGVYKFKRGVVGKAGWEEISLGEFYGCFNLSGRIARTLLERWKFARRIYRRYMAKD